MSSAHYDANYLAKARLMLASTKSRALALLCPTPADTIADIGCGTGEDALDLARQGSKVIGYDSNAEFIAQARLLRSPELQLEFDVADASALPTGEATIDKMRFERVFQHLARPLDVISEARRILRPYGVLQIIDTDYSSLSVFAVPLQLERTISDWLVEQRFPFGRNVRALPNMLQESGFYDLRFEVHPIVLDSYQDARFLVRFDQVVEDLAANNLIDDADRCLWTAFESHQPGAFSLVLSQVVVTAKRAS
jgi:ubiquinone/menaquinone biosynthesis C-methylase UbiE